MLDYVLSKTEEFLSTKPKAERKKYGQFFTSKETAQYMASMFNIPDKRELRILDPGAGSGSLTAALIERLQSLSKPIQSIHLTCYENDDSIVPLLNENLLHIQAVSSIAITFTVITDNYILSQADAFQNYNADESGKYDLIIANPPYFKLPKDAPEAVAMTEVCYGAPNIYFLFASMSLFNLQSQGEMVYIIPRSWTSGAYFKRFREYFLEQGKLLHIHLFVCRDKVFDKEQVLQETIIVKVRKSSKDIEHVKITTSYSNKDFDDITTIYAPYSIVVAGQEKYVYLVTSQADVEALEKVNSLGQPLPKIGLRMKTGLTVDFRNRELLRNEPAEHVVPLFYSQHIQNGSVVFPINKEAEYMTDTVAGMLQINKNYLFVKRFTAKEEKRRLQCGVYLASQLPDYDYISTQNKINFIDTIDGAAMTKELVYGLYVLFNSTLYDTYYRILNGSTQVNSTEINTIPVPPKSIIETLGMLCIERNNFSVETCDTIMEEVLDEKGRGSKILIESA